MRERRRRKAGDLGEVVPAAQTDGVLGIGARTEALRFRCAEWAALQGETALRGR